MQSSDRVLKEVHIGMHTCALAELGMSIMSAQSTLDWYELGTIVLYLYFCCVRVMFGLNEKNGNCRHC